MFSRLSRCEPKHAVWNALRRCVGNTPALSRNFASSQPAAESEAAFKKPTVRQLRNTFDNWGAPAEAAPLGGFAVAEAAREAMIATEQKIAEERAARNELRRQERRKNLELEAKMEREQAELKAKIEARKQRPVSLADADLSFLIKPMTLQNHYNNVARGIKPKLSSGLHNQLEVLHQLSLDPKPEVIANVNVHRLASLAWRILHTQEDIQVRHCDAIVRIASMLPRGRTAPEVQHIGGARSQAWFIKEAHDLSHPSQLNAVYFNRNFEYYKTWMQEASNPATLVVNFVLSLKHRKQITSSVLEGELIAAIVEIGRFDEALVYAAANLKSASHLSPTAIEAAATSFPYYDNITKLPKYRESTPTSEELLRNSITERGLHGAIVASVHTEAYNLAPQYYSLLQQLKGVSQDETVPGLPFDVACAMTVALAQSMGKYESSESIEYREALQYAIVAQAVADNIFTTGSNPQVIDLSQFSDPEVASAVFKYKLAELQEAGKPTKGLTVRIMAHNELLAQKVSAKQAAEAEAGAALSAEQQRELRNMLSQLDLLFETDVSTADFGGQGETQDAITVRQLRTKLEDLSISNPELAIRMGSLAGHFGNNTVRPMAEISAKAGITEVGKPDALLRIAVAEVLTQNSLAFEVNDKASTLTLRN